MSAILSPNKQTGRRAPIRLVVIHTMEVAEVGSVAEAVGHAFANPARQASAHIGVDTDSECRYVADADTAWAAPGANADGLQIELAGRAGQTRADWSDLASHQILERAAKRTAIWCRAYGIPARKLTDRQLADGQTKGIVGHADVSRVFKQSDHTDPGTAFPWDWFIGRVHNLIVGRTTPISQPPSLTKAPSGRIRLSADGVFGPRTKARLQQWAKVKITSSLTKYDWMAIQRIIGATADGAPGPKTWAKLQKQVGATIDGVPGPQTYKALQNYLNQSRSA